MFIGIPLPAFLDPQQMQLLSGYLSPFSQNDICYLGKYVEGAYTFEELESLCAHVESLMKRLSPLTTSPCQLFPTHTSYTIPKKYMHI